MSAIVQRGILLASVPYGDHDAILHIMLKKSKITLLAPGVHKPTSKNRANLFVGALIEFEYFQARYEHKVSRLKTATLLQNWDFEDREQMNFFAAMTNLLNQVDRYNEEIFDFYNYCLSHRLSWDWRDKYIYFLYLMTHLAGVGLNLKSCVKCGSYKEILNLDPALGGFVCALHTLTVTNLIKLKSFHQLSKGYFTFVNLVHQNQFEFMAAFFEAYLLKHGLYFEKLYFYSNSKSSSSS